MPRININLNEVESSNLLQAGTYVVRIKESTKTLTSEGKAGQIMWAVEVLESVDDANEDLVGKTATFFTSLVPQAWWVVKNILEALKVEWNEDGTFELDDTFGCEMGITAREPREYEGKHKNDINPSGFFSIS